MILKNKGKVIRWGIVSFCVVISFFYSCKKDGPVEIPDPGDPSLAGIEFKVPADWPVPPPPTTFEPPQPAEGQTSP